MGKIHFCESHCKNAKTILINSFKLQFNAGKLFLKNPRQKKSNFLVLKIVKKTHRKSKDKRSEIA